MGDFSRLPRQYVLPWGPRPAKSHERGLFLLERVRHSSEVRAQRPLRGSGTASGWGIIWNCPEDSTERGKQACQRVRGEGNLTYDRGMTFADPHISQPFQTTMSADLLVMETVAIVLNALVTLRLFRFIWALGKRMRVARGMIWICALLSLHTSARILQFGTIWMGENSAGFVSRLPLSTAFFILLWLPVFVFDMFGTAAFKREPAPAYFQLTRRIALMAALVFTAAFLLLRFRSMSQGQILFLVAALIANSAMTGYVLLRARHHDPALSNYGIGVLGISGLLTVLECFEVLHPHTHASSSHPLLIRSAVDAGTVLIILSALFIFSSSRFADALLKDILRIYWLGFMLLVAWFGENGLAVHQVGSGGLLSSASQKLVSAAFLLACVAVYRKGQQAMEYLVSSRLFHKPDYATLLESIQWRMRESENIQGWFDTVAHALSSETGLAAARIVSTEELGGEARKLEIAGQEEFFPSPQDLCRLICSPPAEVLLPVRVHSEVRFALAVSSDPFKGEILEVELIFLRKVVRQLEARLEIRRLADAQRERDEHEERLRAQITEAELRALRAQIQPHFLFNSLNTIAQLCIAAPEQAERMTTMLANIFRYVLTSTDDNAIALEHEIRFINDYLAIEQMRFGERLEISIDIEPAAKRMLVPPLILQPLVENALRHGLAPKISGGNICLSAKCRDEMVHLVVEDSGVGLSKAQVSGGNGTHVGLTNIRKRLHVHYGTVASLTLTDRAEGGVRATMILPQSVYGRHIYENTDHR